MKWFLSSLLLLSSLAHARSPYYELSPKLAAGLLAYFETQPSLIGGGSQGSYYFIVDVECAYENGDLTGLKDCYARQRNGFTRNIQAPVKMKFWDEDYRDQVTVLIEEIHANLGEEGLIANGLSGYQITVDCEYRQQSEDTPKYGIKCGFGKME